MNSVIVLSLACSTLAIPFANVIDAMFGTSLETPNHPRPHHIPNFSAIHSGSGTGLPFLFPTATGAFPTASGGMHALPHPGAARPHKSKSLAVDYQLAPTVAPEAKLRRQETGNATSLPSFTLLDPNDTPGSVPVSSSTEGFTLPSPSDEPSVPIPSEPPSPSDEPANPFPTPSDRPSFPFPTGGFPNPTAPFPTGGFPGTGIPTLPTTLATTTRGPRPSEQPTFPELPGDGDHNDEDDGQSWWDFLEELFGGGRGETSP